MQRWIIRSLFCTAWLACVCSALASTEAGPQVAWVKPQGTDVDSIFAQAQAAHKPVFLYWGAVWCPPCNQVKSTVFNRPDFIARSQGFVPVYVDGDAPGAQKLGARFNVRGYPTMILFQPDGSELTRLPGEVDAAQYLQVLNWGLTQSGSARQTRPPPWGQRVPSWRLNPGGCWPTIPGIRMRPSWYRRPTCPRPCCVWPKLARPSYPSWQPDFV